MELKKRKYRAADVRLMIGAVVSKYEDRINLLREKTLELVAENQKLKEELESIKGKEDLVVSTLERAERTAKDVKEDVDALYQLEVERLKKFAEKWNGYFKELRDRYPAYPTTSKAIEIGEKVNELDGTMDAKSIVDHLDAMLPEPKFNPKDKIEEYVANDKTNGFDINEVLYPGALKLEDICKELGLIEEE